MTQPNSSDVVIASDGKVWLADTSATMPTDSSTALSGDWTNLGFISDAGVSAEVGSDQNRLGAWNNGGYDVRRYVTARHLKLTFSLLEVDKDSLPFCFGGGSVTGGGGTNEVQAVGLTGFDGGVADCFKITTQAPVTPAAASALIGFGGATYTAAHIKTAIEGIAGFTGTVSVTDVTNEGFLVEFTGDYGLSNVGLITITNTTGCSGTAYTLVAGSAAAGSEYHFTPPSGSDPVPTKALCVEWADGSKAYRMVVPVGSVTNTPTTVLTRTDSMMLPIEFEALPDGTQDAYDIYTNDPSFA